MDHDIRRIRGREVLWITLEQQPVNQLRAWWLSETAKRIRENPASVIFITGRGRAFSAGLDLNEILEARSAAEPLKCLMEIYKALVTHPSPTACLIGRPAAAGGVGLALCADAVVMTCGAWFTLPARDVYRPLAEVLFPLVAARRSVTRPVFDEWYGQKITASELVDHEHIDKVVHCDGSDPAASLEAAALDILAEGDLYWRSDIPDRLPSDVYNEMNRLIDEAAAASEHPLFIRALEQHLGLDDHRKVFVVHGRSRPVNDAMFRFLRALKLDPMAWETMVEAAGRGSPSIMEVLSAGFAMAQAVVVLMTGDDEAQLLAELRRGLDPAEEEPRLQARPNVFVEAGMAYGICPERTVIVEAGTVTRPSDLEGLHAIRLGSDGALEDLIGRLRTAGCPVVDDGKWKDAFKGVT